MPSFDVVSEVDKQTLINSIDQANRVVSNRFDFKGVEASFELDRENFIITMIADGDFQLQQMLGILQSAVHKNGIDMACMETQKIQSAGKQVKQPITVKNGIDQPLAKNIVKLIKDKKMKVQAQIQGEQVRVTGKKRDDLQQAIALLKGAELEMPLQFENFRD